MKYVSTLLAVRNMARSRQFYHDVLGLNVTADFGANVVLEGVKLVVGDKCLGMLEAVGEVFPDAKYQRCTVHFYRNVFSVVPHSKVKLVAKMLKAIHA